MINIRKIVITLPQEQIYGCSQECYMIVSYADSSHYCSTVVGNEGRFEWAFDKEIVKLTLQHLQPKIRIKLIEYSTCKTIDEFQVQTKDASLSSKTKYLCTQASKNKGTVELQIDYQSQNRHQRKKVEQISSYNRVSKLTSTTNYQQPMSFPSQVQKLSSAKLIPNKQLEYYNFGPYYSPKNTADYLKIYRQTKQTQRYESLLLRKSTSYKFLV